LLWSILVMVRFGYGPFWLWDETSGSDKIVNCPDNVTQFLSVQIIFDSCIH